MQKIMFNDRFGLTQAVLDGRKTQTRRVISPQPVLTGHSGFEWKGKLYGEGISEEETCRNFFNRIKTHYKVGEIIAVAQRYSDCGSASFDEWEKQADWFQKGFANKMFVKPELMPHQVKITNVRLERLQDISDEDCIKEGIIKFGDRFDGNFGLMCQAMPVTSRDAMTLLSFVRLRKMSCKGWLMRFRSTNLLSKNGTTLLLHMIKKTIDVFLTSFTAGTMK